MGCVVETNPLPTSGLCQEEASKTRRWDNWRIAALKGGLLSLVPPGYKGALYLGQGATLKRNCL